jgi:hypothetical protein
MHRQRKDVILPKGIICTFLLLPPPAGEGWGGGSKVKIMTVDSINRFLLRDRVFDVTKKLAL